MRGIKRFFLLVYRRLFRIDDTPQKISAGFGLGVFFGVMPAMGPLAALLAAFVLRVNRAAALLGSIITNTWLSIPLFIAAVTAGSAITGESYADIRGGWQLLLKDFRWSKLFGLSLYKMLFPLLAGYAVVSLSAGIIAYLVVFVILKYVKSAVKGAVKEKGGA